ncbi:hypothetical protein HPB50_006021 [Hyalomma asiaticum]|uniref:Uncharacterized protein n=1 Tax=Hyalomma asiaticum TaxID=266040 RepID=A0ACB7SN32_HYAAI|nr:hypothetical protein HPB50_006021 [Hyalomma asiaticum]
MRFTLTMVALFAGFSEICTRRSFLARALRPLKGTPLSPLSRVRLNIGPVHTGYGNVLSYVPGISYGVGGYGVYPSAGGYGYANGFGYNRLGFAGGPNHNVYQFANVAPYGPAKRFDFTQRSIAGFFNRNDPGLVLGASPMPPVKPEGVVGHNARAVAIRTPLAALLLTLSLHNFLRRFHVRIIPASGNFQWREKA